MAARFEIQLVHGEISSATPADAALQLVT